MLLFVLQKVAFMLINHTYCDSLSLTDGLQVVFHGLRLDMVICCYLMALLLLLCGIFSLLKPLKFRKIMTVWYVLASLVLTIAFLADAVLYNFWGAKLDVADFIYAKNPKDMLASLSGVMVFISLVVVVLLTIGQAFIFRQCTPEKTDKIQNKWMAVLVFVLLLGCDVVGMRGSLKESTANPSYAYFSNNQFLNHAALNPLFNILHSMTKGEDLAGQFQFYDEKELDEIIGDTFISHDDIADTLLATSRPNILLLVWEGGGSLFVDNDTIAPGYAKLKGEGVYFSNLYANNFRTDRGLVSLLNGWLGLPTTSVMKMSGKCRSLPSLAKSLSAQGYHTAFYYGGDIDFTNMRGYLFETGYSHVYGDDHYSWAPVKSKWGVDDQYLLESLTGDLPPQPFFATCLTLSSHEPWEVPYQRLADAKANAFAYTDSCLANMVQQLKQSALWDNLLLIIVPDHGVATANHSPADIEVAKIPMLWLGGAVKRPLEIGRLMNQSDIVATLLCQLGLDARQFIYSRNVMSKGFQPSVVTHAYKNGINIIDSCHTSRFAIVDKQVLPDGNKNAVDEPLIKAILQHLYQITAQL